MLRLLARRVCVLGSRRSLHVTRHRSAALKQLGVSWGHSLRALATAAGDASERVSSKGDEEIRKEVLSAALGFVPQLGWTADAIVAGAEKAGYPPMVQGIVTGGPAELVSFFMEDANRRLAEHLADRQDVMQHMSPRKRLRYAMEHRLRMLQPLRSKWSDAMALGAFPSNMPQTAESLALLADELAHVAGYKYDPVGGGAAKWYLDRAVVSGVYVATELFMLTDESEDNKDTWEFLERRLDGLERAEAAIRVGNIQNLIQSTRTIAVSLGSALQTLMQNQMNRKE
mmetsp:Transcript_235/g.974  ORF Transcript_235/g.974 Transcript_235/m.974 type:complete len:285 (-) Transcript_235:285-1139(-)